MILLSASWLAIFSCCYLFFEIFIFRYIGKVIPANIPYYFDFGTRTFFQYSKSGAIPENYIAIFGDSYAEGQGDWFFNSQFKRMPDTQATHLLYKSTHQDVVTFGVAGAGSIPAYLEYPAVSIQYIRSLWLYDIDDPDTIFLYFYEGNDIQENNSDYTDIYLKNGYDPDKLDDIAYFESFVSNEYIKVDETYIKSHNQNISNNFITARFFKFIISGIWEAISNGTFGQRETLEPQILDNPIDALMNGKKVQTPGLLQSPPLDKSKEEIQVALTIFENSIKLVKKNYPKSRIGLVYIPSPASTYQFLPGTIAIPTNKSDALHATVEIAPASNLLCNQIRAITIKNNINFHDTRQAIRQAATHGFLHGPGDWNHFSETGYRVLADEIYSFYKQINNKTASKNGIVSESCVTLD